MPIPAFEIAADKHGRDVGGLGASGGKLTVDISSVSNGDYLPGTRDDVKEKLWMIRIVATKDCWMRFSLGPDTAIVGDMLFQAGTEEQKLPLGTNYVSAITVDPAATGKLQIAFML